MSTASRPTLDMDKLNAFMGRFVGDLGAAVHAGMVVIGEKLGLYKALAADSLTSKELADKTGTDERYVREWLASQAAGGYVTYDEKTNKFTLNAEQAFALATEDSPAYLPGAFEIALGSLAAVPRITDSFRTGAKVNEVTAQGLTLADGSFIASELVVWAAGVKAPDVLRQLDGLETNRINQLMVHDTLQSTRDERIFAIGDCAACPQPGQDRPVPPRAQAAYQEAMLLARSLEGRRIGKPLRHFLYRDYGSLISLSYSSIGNLMGNLLGSVMLEGMIARLAYLSLYKKHQLALHGFLWVAFATLANLIKRRTEPRLKLH